MRIGIDVSCLQGAHRMRGIGYTAANFLKNIPASSTDQFVLYIDKHGEHDESSVIQHLSLDPSQYIIRYFNDARSNNKSHSKLNQVAKAIKKLRDLSVYRNGDDKYSDIKDLNVFLQLDQGMPMPRVGKKTKVHFIAYDLIPYVFEADYLPGYKTCRQKGRSRRSALKSALNRYVYIKKVKLNVKRADKILAISETTKRDYILYASSPSEKLEVIALGINQPSDSEISKSGSINRYHNTSWGYLPSKTSLKDKKFILFVGGADERRRLNDLVGAFNQLKAQGSDLKLVLSGDIMKGPSHIPSSVIQNSLKDSSYLDDIYFVGFTDDRTRNWLYKNALAFVFPSVYEGFGLPILEAMSFKTPVICYENAAIREVAKNAPIYTNDIYSLMNAIKTVQAMSVKERTTLTEKGLKQSSQYSWHNTTKKILSTMKNTD